MARRRPEPPLDPFERAARRADPDYAVLAEAAEPPKSLRAPRLLLMFGALVVATALVRSGGRADLERSCTTPGFALSDADVTPNAPLEWAATGPAEDHVVLALDSPQVLPTSPVDGPTNLTGCLVHGSFPVQVHPGQHQVTAFVVTPDGTVVARLTKTLTVR